MPTGQKVYAITMETQPGIVGVYTSREKADEALGEWAGAGAVWTRYEPTLDWEPEAEYETEDKKTRLYLYVVPLNGGPMGDDQK